MLEGTKGKHAASLEASRIRGAEVSPTPISTVASANKLNSRAQTSTSATKPDRCQEPFQNRNQVTISTNTSLVLLCNTRSLVTIRLHAGATAGDSSVAAAHAGSPDTQLPARRGCR